MMKSNNADSTPMKITGVNISEISWFAAKNLTVQFSNAVRIDSSLSCCKVKLATPVASAASG